MQASRFLRSSKARLDGYLIPPRTTWDILKSASEGALSLFTDQSKRRAYIDYVDKGVLTPSELSKADYCLVLALYNELNSPTLDKYGFRADEFIEGVKPALEEFHNVEAKLHKSLRSIEFEKIEGIDDAVESDKWKMGARANLDQMLSALAPNQVDKKDIQQMLKHSWKKDIEEKPESLAAQVMNMVTPGNFDLIDMKGKAAYLFDKQSMYEDDSTQVGNVVLLSARAMVVDKKADNEQQYKKVNNEQRYLEMVTLKLEANDDKESEKTVVAQVEVLYDFQQTYSAKLGDTTDAESSSVGDSQLATVTRKNQHVGVFVGWLKGGPDGNNDVRWKMTLSQPAWEFI